MNVYVADLTSRTPPYDRRICEALHRQGCTVDLWAAGSHSRDFDHLGVRRRGWLDVSTRLPIEHKGVVKGLKAAEYVANLVGLALSVWRERPQLVHIQWLPLLEVLPQLELAFLRSCRKCGVGLVYTVHDLLPLDAGARHRAVFRQAYHSVDALICHTQGTRRRLMDEFDVPDGRIRVIPHGPLMDGADALSRKDARIRLGWGSEQPVVLLFGVLRPYKGVEFLLDAWTRVARERVGAKLVIAGSGQERYVRKLTSVIEALPLSDSVETRFAFLPDEELNALIAAADVLVYPYKNITQSGALFAGLNAGKAIVATRVGGLAETLRDGETGLLVEYGDTHALSEALSQLLAHPEERKRLGAAAKRDLEAHFSWEAIAQKTIACYEAALNPELSPETV